MGRGAQDTQPAHGLTMRGRGRQLQPVTASAIIAAEADPTVLNGLLDRAATINEQTFTAIVETLIKQHPQLGAEVVARKTLHNCYDELKRTAGSTAELCEKHNQYKHFVDYKTQARRPAAMKEQLPQFIEEMKPRLARQILESFNTLSFDSPQPNHYRNYIQWALYYLRHAEKVWLAKHLLSSFPTTDSPVHKIVRKASNMAWDEYNQSTKEPIYSDTPTAKRDTIVFSEKDRQVIVGLLMESTRVSFYHYLSKHLFETRSSEELRSYQV